MDGYFYLKRKKRMKLTGIAYYLNSRGVKTRLDKVWYASTVKSILKNPLYSGRVRYNGREFQGTHERII